MKRVVGRLARWLGLVLLAVSILLIGAWCAVAVWFRGIGNEPVRDVLAGATFVLALVTVGCLTTSWRWRGFAFYAAVVAVVLVWWSTIHPSNDRDWTPDVARSVTGTTDGDRVVINNVRDFTWRSDTDFDPQWEQRTYNLSHLTNVDLIMSYWGNEAIAHTIISFGFDDDSRLAFSIETRKERGEAYSSIAGFFKQYDLAIVAGDERDIVRVRSNVRGEDVQIYRLRMTPANAQVLFREYVEEANDLARAPRFYNTLTANCTTLVFKMVRVIHPGLPVDYRVHLPNYAYSLGATDTSVSFERLRELSRIDDKAIRADTDPEFSARIREGVPKP